MNTDKPPITPNLTVADLLNAYPELERVLLELAAPFRKLRNPVLRRTLAKVTTLRKAARVADMPLGELIARLRRAAGQADMPIEEDAPATRSAADYAATGTSPDHATAGTAASSLGSSGRLPIAPPAWMTDGRVVETIDADEMLETGDHPLPHVQRRLREMKPGEILCISGSFRPEPLIHVLEQQGRAVHVQQEGAVRFRTFIRA